MSCEFCEKIWDSRTAYKKSFEDESDEICAIVMEDGEPWLYVPISDWYYSDTYLCLNYCPKCGRKLAVKI